MHHQKPTPLLLRSGSPRRVCPVCGTRSYSRDGIHPQCAQQQADSVRMERLKAEKKSAAAVPKVANPPTLRAWHKLCPRCKVELHVRSMTCDCGYQFPDRKNPQAHLS